MNKIITSLIVDPSVQQPFTGKSLEFLQNSSKEILAAIFESIIGSKPGATEPYFLYGGEETDLGGGDFAYAAGFIYFNGEIYYLPAIASIAIATAPVCTITVTNDATADPCTFSDGSSKNVHNVRRIVISDGALGSADFNYEDITRLGEWIPVTGGIGYQGTWADFSVSNGARYKKVNNYIELGGLVKDGASSTVAFTLPVGYRPAHAIIMISACNFAAIEPAYIDVNILGEVNIKYGGGSDVSLYNLRFPID